MYWLIAHSVRQQIEAAYRSGALPTAEQQAQYEARYGSDAGATSRVLTVAGDVAEVSIAGVITKSPSLLAMLFGGGNVTYSEIVAAFAAADKDPEVKRIEVVIDSPGGHMDGLFEAIAAMQSTAKPTRAVIRNTAASAAYALAVQADEVVALNKAARIGSIGVVATFNTDENTVQVTSTKAPKKRPDPTTDEGQAVIREELDALHELFAEAIAAGRDVTIEKVNESFGQGATFVAEEAVKRGMIDSVASTALRVVKSSSTTQTASKGGNNSEAGPMDLKTLRTEHPEAYAAAVAEGVTSERDRVTAHLVAAQSSGLMDDAVSAIENGTAMTSTLQTKHLMAAANRGDQSRRAGDDAAAAAAADGAAAGGEGSGAQASDLGAAQVAALVEGALGIDGGSNHA